MEVYGNLDAVKQAIEQKYSAEINAINKEANGAIALIKKESESQLKAEKARTDLLVEAESKKAYAKILSEQKLKAKQEFESKREAMINKVFAAAENKAPKMVEDKKYIDFVMKNLPKGEDLVVYAHIDSYKESLPVDSVKVDKSLVGVKFVAGNIEYDFTLDSAINSRKEQLRHAISEVLFK